MNTYEEAENELQFVLKELQAKLSFCQESIASSTETVNRLNVKKGLTQDEIVEKELLENIIKRLKNVEYYYLEEVNKLEKESAKYRIKEKYRHLLEFVDKKI